MTPVALSEESPALLRQGIEQASNPGTAPGILVDLALDKDFPRKVRAAVARNPNTPLKTLFDLWRRDPAAYLENPIREYWALAQSEPPWHVWPDHARWAVYMYLVEKGDGRNLSLFMSEEDRIGTTSHYPLRGPGMARKVNSLAQDPSEAVRFELFNKPYHGNDKQVLAAISKNVFCKLAVDPSRLVRTSVAGLSVTPPSARLILVDDHTKSVRLALAKNPYRGDGKKWMKAVWEKLARDRHDDIRGAICQHAGMDPKLITEISRDKKPLLRMAAANSPSASHETFVRLSRDRAGAVRGAVGQNGKVASEFLDELARRKYDAPLHEGILANGSAPPEALAHILRKCPMAAKMNIFKNPQCDAELIQRLWDELGTAVKLSIAGRPVISADILIALTREPDPRIRFALTERHLGGCYYHTTDTNHKLVALLVKDKDPEIRKRIVHDKRITDVQLAKLGEDVSAAVRCEVAKHFSGSPEETLVMLCRDKDPTIRFEAACNILQRLERYRTYRFYEKYKTLYSKARAALVRLSADQSGKIRTLLSCAPEAPPAVLDALFSCTDPVIVVNIRNRKRFPYGAILDFSIDGSWPRRLKAARIASPCTPSAAALALYAQRENRSLRLLTAMYHRTRIATLRHLAMDDEEIIRATAFSRFKKRLEK